MMQQRDAGTMQHGSARGKFARRRFSSTEGRTNFLLGKQLQDQYFH
jgi:hypothetical protein